MSENWVYTWLDSRGIRTLDQLKAALASAAEIDDLKQAARLVVDTWRSSPPEPRPRSLIAGAGIDLSGRLDCSATSCRRAQVDRLFRRAWHYFETIVARDSIAEDLVVHSNCPDDELRGRLPPNFGTALMVRELGAESLVEFLPRVPACFEHWRDHAKEAGIEDVALREPKMIAQLLRESEINVQPEDDGVLCTIWNPDCSHSQWVHLTQKEVKGKSQDQLKRAAVQTVARKFLVHLTADVKAAHTYGGAFGSTIPLFQKFLANRGNNVGKVAFEAKLPALDGLSTAQLIEVRLKYQDTFSRFRTRLRSFLEECLQCGLTSPEDIQAKLKADLIEGELAELKSNLKQAEAAFKRKSAYGLTLGSLVAIIGASTGVIPPPVAYGLAATVSAASLSPGVAKYVDDMARLKSDDMYFLLQAEAHQH